MRRSLIFALTLVFVHLPIWPQATRGVIVGAVTDQSGAQAPGAVVVITNQGTNTNTKAAVSEEGQYTATNLDPGTYRVTASASGFKTSAVRDIVLNVNQTARVDLRLEVGDVATSVDVEATAPVVQSETSSIGSVVDGRQIATMPLNGRASIYSLLALAPGVQRSAQNPIISASGVWFGATNLTIDGAAVIDFGNERLGPVTPSLEAIGEFKVIGNGASAEFGRGGAQIVVATKSGTNELHGSLFAFNRNRALSARNFFATGLPKPAFNRNEYGGSLGGPVLKDKLFFFGSFEGLRRIGSSTIISAQPTVALKNGNFSGLAPVRDPLTGSPFPNNQIPSDRISGAAREILKYSPDPNQATAAAGGLGNNYIYNSPTRESNDRYSFRVDHNVSDKDRITGRYFQADNGPYISGGGPTERYGSWNGFGAASKSVMASYTRLVSAALVNEARFGFLHTNYFRTPQNNDLDPSRFIPGLISPVPGLGGLPNVNITGFRGYFDNPGSGDRQRNWEFYDNLAWIHRGHSIKTGFEIQRASSFNFQNPAPARGNFNFDGRYTVVPGATVAPANAFADFLLGYASGTTRVTRNLEVEPQNTRWAAYVQDDWTMSPRLTLNLGLRYEYAGLFANGSGGDLANFYPELGKVVIIRGEPNSRFANLPIVSGKDVGIDPSNYMNKDRNNFAPRVGFAWRPLGAPTFVVRSSYGIYYNVIGGYIGPTGLANNPPFRAVETFEPLPGSTPSLTLANAFPGTGSIPANPNINAIARDRVNPYMQQWNFTVEGEVLRNTAVRASYVGNKGTHLDRQFNLNDPPPAPGAVQPRRPYQPFGAIGYYETGRNSILNQLQIGAIRRFANGLSFQIEYQLTKALGEQPFGISAPTDNRNARLDRGDADFLRRHVTTANYTYDLPFGRGKWFGGWRLAGIAGFGTGEPYSVSFSSSTQGWPSSRANIVGDPKVENPTIERWFNPAAFAVPAPFTYGNSARNSLFGPGYVNWDTAVFKNTAITERVNLEFRTEFFNVLNHPTFGTPAGNISVPAQVGRITSTSNTPRDIQFGLRLAF